MNHHRLLASVIVVTAIVTLGCSGLTGGEGTSGSDPKVDTSKLKVGAQSITRQNAGAAPDRERVERSRRKDAYLVKLAPGVKNLQIREGRPATGNSKLDGAFGNLSVNDSRPVH